VTKIKSCGKSHPWCRECRPDVEPFGGRRFVRQKGSHGYPHSEVTKQRISARRRSQPVELREKRTQVKVRRDVEDYLDVRLDPLAQVVHHVEHDGGDGLENLAVLPRVVHQAVHTLERYGLEVDLTPLVVRKR
jgi:hypothetical protein